MGIKRTAKEMELIKSYGVESIFLQYPDRDLSISGALAVMWNQIAKNPKQLIPNRLIYKSGRDNPKKASEMFLNFTSAKQRLIVEKIINDG